MDDIRLLALAGVRVVPVPHLPRVCIYVHEHRIALLDTTASREVRDDALAWLLEQSWIGDQESPETAPSPDHRPV